MAIKASTLQQALILIAIAITPIFTLKEVLGIFLTLKPGAATITPFYIKIIKDFIFTLLLLVGLGAAIYDKKNRLFFDYHLFFFLLLCFISALVSLFVTNLPLVIVASGMRWLLPILLIPFMVNHTITNKLQFEITKILQVLFILSLGFQLFQAFYFPHWWGSNFFGLAARNTGFFAVPSPMSFFPVVVAYYTDNFSKKQRLKQLIIFVLAPISIYLTASGTGAVIYCIFIAIKLFFETPKPSTRGIALLLMPFLLFIFLAALPILLNRGSKLYEISGQKRIEILFENIRWDTIFFSGNYGVGTNTAVSINRSNTLSNSNLGRIIDSTITSIIVNAGFLALFMFFIFMYSSLKLKKIHFQFVAIFSLYMLTNILFESYPYNLLFGINILYLHKFG